MKKILIALMSIVLLSSCANNTNDENSIEKVVVKDEKGEVSIPKEPMRIVDLSGNSDILSILGYKVVGTANSDAYDYTKFPSYLEKELNGASILGYNMQDTMDIEGVMNLNPDLIIISTVQDKMYEQLKEIAPTIMIKNNDTDWKENIKTLAKILDKESIADEWLKNYEIKAKKVGDEIRAKFSKDTTYLSFLASGGQFYIYTPTAGLGSVIYEDLGLAVPKGLPKQSDVSLPVASYEGLAQIDSDYILVMGTAEDMKTLENSSVWKGLPAVKNKHVVILPTSPYFTQAYSYIGRDKLLDEIMGLLNEAK